MILTVTLNAALDRTLQVPNFHVGLRHRASSSLTLPGGKGVNVARALKTLGQPVIATGLAGGRIGTFIIEELTAEGILNDFVRIQDNSRTSTAVADPTSGSQTEINEHGPTVLPSELDVLMEKLHYLCKGADLVVLAGSLPPAVPQDFYATAIRELKRAGVATALDCAGPPLRAGVAAEPTFVSPNRREAEEIVGHEFQDVDDLAAGAESLVAMGAESALIHHEEGCVAMLREGRGHRTWKATLPGVEVVSTVGSGDSFLAGFLSAWYGKESHESALRRAVACGAANTRMLGAGRFEPADLEAFARQVEVEEIT